MRRRQDRKANHRLRRIAPLCGVLGAFIILTSWFISNTIKKRVESLEARLEQIMRDKAQNDHFTEISNVLSSMHRDLMALSTSYQATQRRGFDLTSPLESQEISEATEGQWDRLFLSDLWATQKEAARLKDFLDRVPMPAPVELQVKTTASAMDSLVSLVTVMGESVFAAETTLIGYDDYFVDELTDEERRDLLDVREAYHQRLRAEVGPRHAEQSRRLEQAYEAVLDFAKRELTRRKKEVRVVRVLELVLYGLGSLIVISGKWIESKSSRIMQSNARRTRRVRM